MDFQKVSCDDRIDHKLNVLRLGPFYIEVFKLKIMRILFLL